MKFIQKHIAWWLGSYLLVFLISFLFLLPAQAGPSYVPKIQNYSVSDYSGGNQNWAITQGRSGEIYVGNNRGFLSYDGSRWTMRALPNHIGLRSVCEASDGKVYVGSYNEFGYFERDADGQGMSYHSLVAGTDHLRFTNDEIWTIHEYEGKIYFQSFKNYFVYDGERVTQGEEQSPFFFFKVNDRFYAQFEGGGLCVMREGRFVEILERKRINNDGLVAVLPYGERLMLITALSGLYLFDPASGHLESWNLPVGEVLKKKVANRALMMPDSTYVVGMLSDGVVAFDKHGKELWHVNRENGLINNTVLNLAVDKAGNVWAALDNGIAHILVNFPVYFYEPVESQIGMVHDLAIDGDNVYMATNQGLYLLTDQDKDPQLVPGTKEQNWCIKKFGHQLIVGHNRGALSISGRTARHIEGPVSGGTALCRGTIMGREVLLLASYGVLSVFLWDQGSEEWRFSNNVEGFNDLIRYVEIDPMGNIWASHMYKGLYRLRLDEDLRHIKDQERFMRLDTLKKEGTINVMRLRGRVVFSDGDKFYTYADLESKIVPYDVLNEHFPELGDTYRIIPMLGDRFWFIRNTEYVMLEYSKGQYHIRMRLPFSLFDNPTIEDRGNIFVSDDGVSYFCLNGGIARFEPSFFGKTRERFPLMLASVKAFGRDEENEIQLSIKDRLDVDKHMVDPEQNNISFDLYFPNFTGGKYLYSYKLEGYEQEWSERTTEATRSYHNLPYGKYTLRVTVSDNTGRELSSLAYAFGIKTPFYRTYWAFLFYFLIFVFLLWWLGRRYIAWIVAKEKRANEELQRQQEAQLREQERQITALKNEKLENELTYKSKELASATLSVITHNEFLASLKKEVQAQMVSGSNSRRFYEKLIRMIDESISNEDDWTIFQTNFDRIHEHFFTKLKERYPDLTAGDLRLCALLRLNMPTKDMARVQNLTVRGVEAARYRLRKKLNLSEGQSLVDFMIQFH